MISTRSQRSKEKIRADLIWTRDTAPIYLGVDGAEITQVLNQIKKVDVEHFDLEIDDSKWFSGRLGRYFESLFEILLNNESSVLNFEKNVVIKNKVQTLGEFDFLCELQSSILHFEVAIKFFLKAELNGIHDFWGPRKKDSLGSKIARINSHQLKLELPQRWQEKNKECKRLALMKGVLFYPWEEFVSGKFEFPEHVSANHTKGWWIPRGAVDLIVGNGIEFLCPVKLDWLAFDSMKDSKKMRESDLRKYLNEAEELSDNYKEAMLVVRVDKSGRELDRGFIVNDLW